MNKEQPILLSNLANTPEFREFLTNELDNDILMKLKAAVETNLELSASLDSAVREKILLYDNDLAKKNQQILDDLNKDVK